MSKIYKIQFLCEEELSKKLCKSALFATVSGEAEHIIEDYYDYHVVKQGPEDIFAPDKGEKRDGDDQVAEFLSQISRNVRGARIRMRTKSGYPFEIAFLPISDNDEQCRIELEINDDEVTSRTGFREVLQIAQQIFLDLDITYAALRHEEQRPIPTEAEELQRTPLTTFTLLSEELAEMMAPKIYRISILDVVEFKRFENGGVMIVIEDEFPDLDEINRELNDKIDLNTSRLY